MSKRKTKPPIRQDSRATGSLDTHFGEKLRARRRMMVPKMSQEMLAQELGLTFQQVQKYEKGVNRISTATLVQIAAVLKVDVQCFFDELPTGAKNLKEIKTPALVQMSMAAHASSLDRRLPEIKE